MRDSSGNSISLAERHRLAAARKQAHDALAGGLADAVAFWLVTLRDQNADPYLRLACSREIANRGGLPALERQQVSVATPEPKPFDFSGLPRDILERAGLIGPARNGHPDDGKFH